MVGLALLTLAFVSVLVGSNNSVGDGCLMSAFSLLTDSLIVNRLPQVDAMI